MYYIILLIDALEIFSQYYVYFLTSSHFAQNLKMALLSLLLNLEAQYCTQSKTQSGATYNQGIMDFYSMEKSYKCSNNFTFWNLLFPWNLPDFMKSARFHHEIHQTSWNLPDFIMKSTGFHEICQISPWNLPDFMQWISWNLADFMKDPKWAKDQWSYFYIVISKTYVLQARLCVLTFLQWYNYWRQGKSRKVKVAYSTAWRKKPFQCQLHG